jgi:hypothetical protein
VHLRLPAIDHGVVSFFWAAFFGVFIWLGLLAIGVSQATAVILAALAFGAIFLYVYTYGVDEPRPQRQPTRPRGRMR